MSNFGTAFLSSVSMIWATELGDKTFFIAALMAMQYSPWVTFSGAMSALAVMTVLSTGMGHLVPNLIPPKVTNLVAVVLFAFFGLRMLREAYQHPSGHGADAESEELKEAMEVVKAGRSSTGADVENPGDHAITNKGRPFTRFSPVFAQAFSLTFLAEWGDRSQLATIALGTTQDPYGVVLGACAGHFMCTGLAVVGGQFLSRRVSPKTISYFGGVLFLVFALFTLLHQEMPDSASEQISKLMVATKAAAPSSPAAVAAAVADPAN
eukprot:RCo043975